jgi:TrmH family RNA methyltransferase
VKELGEVELNQVADTIHAQGVVAVVQQKTHTIDEEHLRRASLIVAADGVSDPGNLGSIVRSSDWFAADMVLLGQGCVDLYNDKVVRSTVGSILHVPVVEGVDLPSALASIKESGFSVVAFSGDGKQTYAEHRPTEKQVVVFGNEAHGVSREVRGIADSVVRIPKYGKAESLNVGVACGIVLAHLREQREKKERD